MGEFTIAEEVDALSQEDIMLTDGVLRYSIRVRGEHAGPMEAIPGRLEHIEGRRTGKRLGRGQSCA